MHVLFLIVIALVVAGGLVVWMTSIRSCEMPGDQVLPRMADIAPGAWERLNHKKIFFGRHSVGRNIIQGIRDVMTTHPYLRLRIVNTKDVEQFGDAILAHAGVGRNFDPTSKIVEFESLMDSGLGEKVDIAFFKLCFVDIASTGDPNSVLAAYCEAMTRLRRRYPKTVFVHVTVPLAGPPRTGRGILKASVKRFIGRPSVLADNQMRARYNVLLRNHFAESEPVFDLALYETLGREGQRYYSMWNDREVPILARMYTDDGGHLNALGRRHVAEQLLIHLARLPEASDS